MEICNGISKPFQLPVLYLGEQTEKHWFPYCVFGKVVLSDRKFLPSFTLSSTIIWEAGFTKVSITYPDGLWLSLSILHNVCVSPVSEVSNPLAKHILQ